MNQVSFCAFLLILAFRGIECVPIFTNDENLKSIVISELDLPTEASIPSDKDIIPELYKNESFAELYDKYNEEFIKNSTSLTDDINEDENPLQKRSSDDENHDEDETSKSVIDKIQSIDDPEVRKEFEQEISNNGKVLKTEEEDENPSDDGTEYDPNYSKKLVVQQRDSENSIKDFDSTTNFTLHEKENLQVHLVEQLVHNMSDSSSDYTTIIPDVNFSHHEQIKNPEIVEVLEHIVYQSSTPDASDATTAGTLNVQVDFDPIEIIPKDRHRFRNVEDVETTSEKNDKFVGFKPDEDLLEPGEETTEPDLFFKKAEIEEDTDEKAIIDTLEFVAVFGKSMKFDNGTTRSIETEISTTEMPVKTSKITTQTYDDVTEIVETHTEISVNIHVSGDKTEVVKSESSSDNSKKTSSSGESSEEKKAGKVEKVVKVETKKNKNSSGESSEENSAKEETDSKESRSMGLEKIDKVGENELNKLMVDLYKDTTQHEIKKKDHPEEILTPPEIEKKSIIKTEVQPRSTMLNIASTPEITQSQSDVTSAPVVPQEATVGIIDTIEDVYTTVSDGIKLSNDLRGTIDSFRGFTDENKTVLDTNSEIISSKNIKTNLVNIAEEMTLENHAKAAEVSYFSVVFLAATSAVVLVGLYLGLKRKASRILLQ